LVRTALTLPEAGSSLPAWLTKRWISPCFEQVAT
jgi:hypothetical protein